MDLFEFDITVPLGDSGRAITACGSLSRNSVLQVKGPSGIGKSTLLKAMARLARVGSGTILLDGRSSDSIPSQAWRRRIHYNAQIPAVHDGDVFQNILVPYTFRGMVGEKPPEMDSVRRDMDFLGLSVPMDQDVRNLSGGEMSRVALLRACLSGCGILLLDEPTASLDEDSRNLVVGYLKEWVRRDGRAMIIISHNQTDSAGFDNLASIEPNPVCGGVCS